MRVTWGAHVPEDCWMVVELRQRARCAPYTSQYILSCYLINLGSIRHHLHAEL